MMRMCDVQRPPTELSARDRKVPWTLTLLFAAALLVGCDLSDGAAVSLRIDSPVDGETFANSDDVDRKSAGFQVTVRVSTVGVADGSIVELYRLKNGEADGPLARASTLDGEARFDAFTLQSGANELQARLQDSARVSEPIGVVFDNRCGNIEFVEPTRLAKNEIRLGPGDDRDAEACGDTFTTRVVASTGLSDGTEVALLVNGEVSRSAQTMGGVATFDGVVLGNRGELPNQLAIQVTGATCAAVELPFDVFVDCLGPSCNLGGPAGSELSSAQDKDKNSAGLQLDLDVQSDASGENVRLVINGDVDNARMAEAKKGIASFTSVSLPEGKGVRVKAICSGANGATSSSERLFNVDTTACVVSISEPRTSEVFVATQTNDALAPDATTDIEVVAALGSDCVSFRAIASASADCTDIAFAAPTRLKAGQTAIDSEVTLSANGPQHVCVQVADAAGNTADATVRVSFDKQVADLTISNPPAALSINRAGTQGRVADANLTTPACDRPVQVTCSEAGAQVQVVTQPEGVVLASALCTNGNASFASVPLPSRNDGASYEIVARSKGANGLVGRSEPRTILADCQPQTLSFSNLSCGVSTVRPSDDADLVKAGIQYDLLLESFPAPLPVATLTLDDVPVTPSAPIDASEGLTLFKNVTFAVDTSPVLKACATDGAGNTSCTQACEIFVGNVPTVSLISPTGAAVLTSDLSASGVSYLNGAPASSDCAAGTDGLQIAVKASTNAPNVRAARIRLMSSGDADATEIASVSTSVAGGEVNGCLDTADGDGLVVRVEVDHTVSGVYGVAVRSLRIDGHAPSSPVALSNTAAACRSTTLRFGEVLDVPAALGVPRKLEGFALRCASTPIVSEPVWNAATSVAVQPVSNVTNTGALEYSVELGSRPAASRFCMVRGYDAAFALTPLANAVEVSAPALRERAFELACIDNGVRCVPMADGSTDTDPNGTRAVAVGDVNGDAIDDLLIAGGSLGAPGTAALYFGSRAGVSTTASARFVSSESLPNMAQMAVGIGDFNADGYDDFALSAGAMRMVFIVFGRPTSAWPSAPIRLDNGACAADLCIAHDLDAGVGLAAAADFDGDGIDDLALSAASNVVSVVRGSASYRSNAALGGTATGVCLDARTRTTGPSSALMCSNPGAPSGFHIFTPAAPYLVQTVGQRLYISHRGTPDNAVVWSIAQRPYTQLSGMQHIGAPDDFSALALTHDLGTTANSLFDRALSGLGDIDGDGLLDLAAGIDQSSGRFYVYRGQADGSVAFTNGAQVGYVFNNAQANNAGDFFGDDIALAYHPVFGLLGDVDNDGLGDILTSSKQDGLAIGSNDLFYGSKIQSLARDRSTADLTFDDSTLSHPATGAAGYVRRAEYIGDVDGDGRMDLAISEENFSKAGQHGRVLILGECNAL